MTGHGNFREQIATIKPYKGNRDALHKPKYYKQIKEYMLEQYGAELVHGREADDAIVTAQWNAKDKDTVIVSVDKDLTMCPGHHYNPFKDEHFKINLAYANARLFWQMLEGDTGDNIPGIKGVGPKTIQKWFDEVEWDLDKLREIVKEQYKKQYGEEWEAAYVECAALLWIERVKGKRCPYL